MTPIEFANTFKAATNDCQKVLELLKLWDTFTLKQKLDIAFYISPSDAEVREFDAKRKKVKDALELSETHKVRKPKIINNRREVA